MIVQVDNTNFNQYDKFFAEAYQYLEELGTEEAPIIQSIDKSPDRKFTSLNQYFKYIEVFKNSPRKNYFLLKLPLDEGLFNIDANTRDIAIPPDFVKSSIVQSDKIAETIVFTINRFIDNIDLCNVDKVYVQWSAPNGQGGVREWATPVTLIDRESIPEKIKFGWTIDDAVTLFPGTVSFSVAFLIEDDDQVGKVKYRLNTLPKTFEVKAALQPTINSNSTINNPAAALNAAIRNNRYPGDGNRVPITPEFIEPGLDLPQEEMLKGTGNGSLTLKAQAVVSDVGTVGYTWFFIPDSGEFKYRCGARPTTDEDKVSTYSFTFKALTDTNDAHKIKKADFDLLTDSSKAYFRGTDNVSATEYELNGTDDVELHYNNIGVVSETYELVTVDLDTLDPRERLYVLDQKNAYAPYTGAETQLLLNKYKKYTNFTLPATGDVIGEYYVEAENFINGETSGPAQSTSCYLNGPEDIVILTDLPQNLFIESTKTYHQTKISASEYNLILDDNKAELFEEIEEDDGSVSYMAKRNGTTVQVRSYNLSINLRPTESTSFTYDWYKSLTEKASPQDFINSEKIPGQNSNTLTVTDKGWYKVNISANKNRKNLADESIICRVLENPIVPTLEIVEYDENDSQNTSSEGVWKNLDEDGVVPYYDIDARKNDSIRLVVNGKIMSGTADKSNDKLYSDGIKYEWRIFDEELGEFVVLTEYAHSSQILPSVNPNFDDKNSSETFSNHPTKLVYKFDGEPVQIACFAINTLHTKDTLNQPIAQYFKIS